MGTYFKSAYKHTQFLAGNPQDAENVLSIKIEELRQAIRERVKKTTESFQECYRHSERESSNGGHVAIAR